MKHRNTRTDRQVPSLLLLTTNINFQAHLVSLIVSIERVAVPFDITLLLFIINVGICNITGHSCSPDLDIITMAANLYIRPPY